MSRISGRLAIGSVSALLVACGSGGDGVVKPDTARPSVVAGFKASTDEGEGGSAGEGGGHGDGGIGAGGSLGAFRNVQFKVTGSAALLIGQATVESDSAVTIYPPPNYTGIIDVEIEGVADSEYFDEGTESNVKAGSGPILRAVVSNASKHIGVTLLTTAAAKVLDDRIAAGSAQQDSAADVDAANKLVQQEINKFLPADKQVADITQLPVLVDSATQLSSLGGTSEGRYAQTLASIAVAAKDFNPSLARPALSFKQNLINDMGDGKIDNRDKDGNEIAPAQNLAYDTTRLKNDLSNALGRVVSSAPDTVGRIPSKIVCLEKMTDNFSNSYRLLGIDAAESHARCQYDFNNGEKVIFQLAFSYFNDKAGTVDTSQCSAPGEFRSVPFTAGQSIESTKRLVRVDLPNTFTRDLAIEALRRAVNDGVGAAC